MFVVAGVGLLCSLGAWQLGRRSDARAELEHYHERLELPAFDADRPVDAAELRRVAATGVPEWDRHLRVHGRYMWSQAGLQILVPLRMASGRRVLVDVGWVPSDEAEAILARERSVAGVRTYTGLARTAVAAPRPEGDYPPEAGYQRDWRAIDPPAMARATGFDGPAWILVDGEGLAPEADIPDRDPPISGWRMEPEQRPHGEYAFTWFALASTLLLVWASASTRVGPGADVVPGVQGPGVKGVADGGGVR